MANTERLLKILNDKTTKAKAKVISISDLLSDGKVSIEDIIGASKNGNDVNTGTLIESMEYASKIKPATVNEKGFEFAVSNLKSTAPRVKWESAKVIANTAQLFPKKLKTAVLHLLDNTEHSGTVVRWSAAGALSKIIECKTSLNKELIPTVEAIEKREEDNAIKKIYQKALKKATK